MKQAIYLVGITKMSMYLMTTFFFFISPINFSVKKKKKLPSFIVCVLRFLFYFFVVVESIKVLYFVHIFEK